MKKIQITNLMKKIGNILIEGFEGKNLTVKQLNKKVAEREVEYTLLNDCELSYESLGEKIVLSKEGDKYVQEI